MPDISMCSGDGCDQRETCYRFKAAPGLRQAYFSTPPHDGGKCEYHMPLRPRHKPERGENGK